VKGSGRFLGIGQVAASTTSSLLWRCAAPCVLAADVALLLPHAVRTAECAHFDPAGGCEVQSEESDVALRYPFSPPLKLSCLGMNNAAAGLSVLVCRPRDTTAGC
jgi:hypothetical protein